MPNNSTGEVSERLMILVSNIVGLIKNFDGEIENLTENEQLKEELIFLLTQQNFISIDDEDRIGEEESIMLGLSRANIILDNLAEFQPDLIEIIRSMAVLFLEKDDTKKSKKLAIAILESYTSDWGEINKITDELKPADLIGFANRELYEVVFEELEELSPIEQLNVAKHWINHPVFEISIQKADSDSLRNIFSSITNSNKSEQELIRICAQTEREDFTEFLKTLKSVYYSERDKQKSLEKDINKFLDKTISHLKDFGYKTFYIRQSLISNLDSANNTATNTHFQSIIATYDFDNEGFIFSLLDSSPASQKYTLPIKDEEVIRSILTNIAFSAFSSNTPDKILRNIDVSKQIFTDPSITVTINQNIDYAQKGSVSCGIQSVDNIFRHACGYKVKFSFTEDLAISTVNFKNFGLVMVNDSGHSSESDENMSLDNNHNETEKTQSEEVGEVSTQIGEQMDDTIRTTCRVL